MSDGKYPECEKMGKVSDESQKIGEFLHWLNFHTEFVLAEWNDRDEFLYQSPIRIESLLARYFEIDMSKVEEERRDILDSIRAQNL